MTELEIQVLLCRLYNHCAAIIVILNLLSLLKHLTSYFRKKRLRKWALDMVLYIKEVGTCFKLVREVGNNHRDSWYHNRVHSQWDFRDSFGRGWRTEGSICIFVVHLFIYALLRVPCRSLLRFLPSFSYRFYQISHSEPQWSGFSNPPQFLFSWRGKWTGPG